MASYEIDCDECGGYAEGRHSQSVKTICIHCYRAVENQNRKLKKQLLKLQKQVIRNEP